MVALMFTDILDCLQKEMIQQYNKDSALARNLKQCGIYVLHSTYLIVSKIAFGFAFIVKNVYVSHFCD